MKINPPHLYQAAIVLMVALHFLVPIATVLRFPWTLAGVLVFLVGARFAVSARQIYRDHGTPFEPRETPVHLHADGPFARSRNPMYVGIFVGLIGIAMSLGSAVAFIPPVLFLTAMALYFVPREERNMEATFGEQYREYKKRVPRWFLFV